METPQSVILPQSGDLNPAKIVDFGGMSLDRVLDYCNRVLQWPKVHLPLIDSMKPTPIGELQESTIRRASFDYHSPLPDGVTVRRAVLGTTVIAIYSQEDGNIVGTSIEAVKITPELEELISDFDDGYEYEEEEFDDEEFDEEYEDSEPDEEDEYPELDEEDLDDEDLDDEDLDSDTEDEDSDTEDEDQGTEDEDQGTEDEDSDTEDEDSDTEDEDQGTEDQDTEDDAQETGSEDQDSK